MEGHATVMADLRVLELSERGGNLEMGMPLAVDSVCDISLNLAHGSVDVLAKVLSVRPSETSPGRHAVVVEFVQLADMDRALLESFLERERRRSP
jgi:hypothetical protein